MPLDNLTMRCSTHPSVKSQLSRAVRGLANSLVGFRCLITRSCREKKNNTLAGTRRSHSCMQAKMKKRICLRFQNRLTTITHTHFLFPILCISTECKTPILRLRVHHTAAATAYQVHIQGHVRRKKLGPAQ
jgi:hypothetical protein